MVFSMMIGLSFVSCFSSSDSRTIKFGNVVGKGSLSESLSGYGRLEGFDEAIYKQCIQMQGWMGRIEVLYNTAVLASPALGSMEPH